MNREKLLELADFALTIPQEKFCMSIWKQSCGSAGCLIGHAITAGLLPGLEFAVPEALMPGRCQPHTIGGSSPMRLKGKINSQRGWSFGGFYDSEDWAFAAVARELGITTAQAEDLFAPGAYPLEEVELDNESDDPEDHIPREWVAERIREFVAEGDGGGDAEGELESAADGWLDEAEREGDEL